MFFYFIQENPTVNTDSGKAKDKDDDDGEQEESTLDVSSSSNSKYKFTDYVEKHPLVEDWLPKEYQVCTLIYSHFNDNSNELLLSFKMM